MTLLETIKEKLNADTRLNYGGRGNNQGYWKSYTSSEKYDKDEHDNPRNGIIELKKRIGQKGHAAVRIWLYKVDEEGLEMKIEMYIMGYYEWYSMFEGFVETEQDFDRLMVMMGLGL